MTAAEKQAAYRARKSALTVTVTINREDINALQTLINAGVEQVDTVGADTVERIREAIHRAKTNG
jgi:mannose/fructose/N-acetylgalactosamine-specific phosphotransferase system component IIB